MNITNAKYFNNFITGKPHYIEAQINGIKTNIPLDPDNIDYAEIMRQVESGELTIEPADTE